jgi:nucleotide-binding universal stress UspA family protein
MFQRILVPLDGSERAEQALPIAARLARASSGELLLVRVVNPPIDYSGGLSPVPTISEVTVESEMREAADYLAEVARRGLLAGIASETEVRFGYPAPQLMGAAEAHGCDLIVLCSHGRTGMSRWALGSVAHTLAHQSGLPVLVLRWARERANDEQERPFSTLVPLDGSQLAEAALAPAAALTEALAAPRRGVLHLAQVVKDIRSSVAEGKILELNEEAHRLARSYLNNVAERLASQEAGGRLTLTTSVEAASDTARALLGLAEQDGPGGCDLIAISTHGRGGLERWAMGSVTDRLLNATHLPVLVIRPRK